MSTKRRAGTADRILDTAEHLVQVRGFNAFSYADIAQALGIQKASLHHHFPTKAALGQALIARYRASFVRALESIEAGPGDATVRLRRYTGLYATVLRRGRMCMCGMLATDSATLPRKMRDGVAAFFGENEAWLARVLERGRKRGELHFEGPAGAMAALFVSSLEGAMLVARGGGRPRYLDGVARRLLASVRPGAKQARRTG